MAVPTTTLSDRYDCDNSNQAFPITFVYLDSGNIAVQLYDGSLGTFETLVEDTDYTVANDTVTTVATYAAKYDIIIQLDPDLTQLTDWVNNDKFTSDSWENAVDKLTLITKMLQDQIDRCARGPDGDASLEWKLADGAVDRAGNYLHFNSITGAIETVGVLTASITATAFAQTILDDVSMGDVLTTLGLTTGGAQAATLAQTLLTDATATSMRTTTQSAEDNIEKGYMNLGMTAMGTVSVPTFTGDVEVNGTLVSFSTESGTNWTGIGASSDVWVYATSNGTVLYSTAAPAWDSAKGGWYNSTSRAAAWIRKDSGNAYRYKHFLPTEQGAAILFDDSFDLGDWDMSATDTLSVAHELDIANILSVSVMIRNDAITIHTPFEGYNPTFTDVEGNIRMTGGNMEINRRGAGQYDSNQYDDTSFNRGWVTIKHRAL